MRVTAAQSARRTASASFSITARIAAMSCSLKAMLSQCPTYEIGEIELQGVLSRHRTGRHHRVDQERLNDALRMWRNAGILARERALQGNIERFEYLPHQPALGKIAEGRGNENGLLRKLMRASRFSRGGSASHRPPSAASAGQAAIALGNPFANLDERTANGRIYIPIF